MNAGAATYPLALPEEDAVTRPWWQATRERRLLVQQCNCGHAQHYPRPICLACGANDPPFVEVAGTATVVTVTAVHRAPHPDLPTPYLVALVDLAEGPRLLTRLVVEGDDPAAVTPLAADPATCIGRPATLGWWPLPDGRALPVFHPDVDADATSGPTAQSSDERKN